MLDWNDKELRLNRQMTACCSKNDSIQLSKGKLMGLQK